MTEFGYSRACEEKVMMSGEDSCGPFIKMQVLGPPSVILLGAEPRTPSLSGHRSDSGTSGLRDTFRKRLLLRTWRKLWTRNATKISTYTHQILCPVPGESRVPPWIPN